MQGDDLLIPLPPVEVGFEEHLPEFGATTQQMKVLNEGYGAHALKISVAAPGGSIQTLDIRVNDARGLAASDGDLQMHGTDTGTLQVGFPPGNGYVQKDVTLTWKQASARRQGGQR